MNHHHVYCTSTPKVGKTRKKESEPTLVDVCKPVDAKQRKTKHVTKANTIQLTTRMLVRRGYVECMRNEVQNHLVVDTVELITGVCIVGSR